MNRFIFIAFNYVHNRTVDKRVSIKYFGVLQRVVYCAATLGLIHDLMKVIETQFYDRLKYVL